jgi:hypothetical protein
MRPDPGQARAGQLETASARAPRGRGRPAASPDLPARLGRARRLPARPRQVPPDTAPGLPPLHGPQRHRRADRLPPAAATGSGSAPPPAPTPATSMPAGCLRSSARSAGTSPSCTATGGGKSRPPSATPRTPSTRPCVGTWTPRQRGRACISSTPAPGHRPRPGPTPAGNTTSPATSSSRSRSTPTSSGSPGAACRRTTPATTRHPEASKPTVGASNTGRGTAN